MGGVSRKKTASGTLSPPPSLLRRWSATNAGRISNRWLPPPGCKSAVAGFQAVTVESATGPTYPALAQAIEVLAPRPPPR
eukprot:scaffold130981_cov36-Phaeocystis_antarctica.AAC.1